MPATPARLLMRRVRPSDWSGAYHVSEPNAAVFIPRADEYLSCYDRGRCKPRTLLQGYIDGLHRKLSEDLSEKDRAYFQRKLDATPTVEAMVKAGWGVVEFSSAALPDDVALGETEDDGHVELEGELEVLERIAPDLAELSVPISTADCLQA